MLPPRIEISLRNNFGGARDAEFLLLNKLVPKACTAIDIGAHIGTYTHVLAKLVGGLGSVHAFEPQFDPYKYMVKGFKNRTNIDVYNYALGQVLGNSDIYIPLPGSNTRFGSAGASTTRKGGALSYQIEIKTLDSFGFSNIGFIKIDTEGNEMPILIGAEKSIKANLPTIMIEVLANSPVDNSEFIWEFLHEKFGYNCVHLEEGKLVSTPNGQYLGKITKRSGDRSFNYIFIHPTKSIELFTTHH